MGEARSRVELTFCRVTGSCRLRPLNAPSLSSAKQRFSASWYRLSAAAKAFTTAGPVGDNPTDGTDISLVAVSRTLPSS